MGILRTRGSSRPGLRRLLVAGAVAGAVGLFLQAQPQSADAATVTVTSLSGDPLVVGSLPYVVANDAASGDTIDFSVTGTITLDNLLFLADDVTILGPGTQGITITRTGGAMIRIQSGADVTLNNLGFDDSTGSAVEVFSGGDVSVIDSVFTDNQVGLEVNVADAVTVTDSGFTGNTGRAIDLEDIDGPVVIGGTAGTTVDNGAAVVATGGGIFIDTAASVAVTNTDVDDQAQPGIQFVGDNSDATAESITIAGSSLDGNDGGIRVSSTHGDVTISTTMVTGTVSAGGNGFGIGIRFQSVAEVELTTVSVSGSDNSAVRSFGSDSVTATGLTITSNPGGGASFDSVTGDVDINGGSYNLNSFTALGMDDVSGTTTLDGVTISDNLQQGLEASSTGNFTITGATVLDANGARAIDLFSVGVVDIAGVTVTANREGIEVTNAGSVSISGSTIDDQITGSGQVNGEGVVIDGAVGAISLTSNNIRDNASNGVRITRRSIAPSTATTTFTGSTITGNGGVGISFNDFALLEANETSGTWTVSNSTISTNTTGVTGSSLSSLLVVDDVDFTTNPVGLDVDVAGGVTVTASTFIGHTGKAIDLDDPGAVTITNVDVENDGGVGQTGMGVDVDDPTSVAVDDLVVADQTQAGLAVRGDNSDATAESVSIINSQFTGNLSGASVSSTDGPVTVTATTTTNSTGGVGLSIGDSTVTLLTNITSTGNLSSGVSLGDVGTLTATDLTAGTNGTGLFLNGSSGNIAISSSDFVGNSSRGISIINAGGIVTLQTGITSTGNGSDGIAVFTATGVTIDDATATGNVLGVNLNSAGVVDITSLNASTNVGGGLTSTNAASISVDMSTFDSNTAGASSFDGSGVSIDSTTGAVSFDNSNMRNNAGEGIELNRSAGGTVTTSVDIDNAIITGNGKQGINARLLAGPLAIDTVTLANQSQGLVVDDSDDVTATAVTLDDHSGVAVEITDSGDLDLDLDVAQSTNDGLGVRLVDSDAIILRGVTVTGQAADVLLIDGDSNDVVPPSVTILGGSFAGSTSSGPVIRDVGDVTITGPVSMSGNAGDGLTITQAGDVELTDVTVDSSEGDGITVSNAGSLVGVDVSADSNEGHGLAIGSSGSLSITRGSFDANGTVDVSDGLGASNLTGGLVLIDVSADGNSDDGIDLAAAVPSGADPMGEVTFTNISATNNVSDGFRAVTTSAVADPGPMTLSVAAPATVSNFDDNGDVGLLLDSAGSLSVSDASAHRNRLGADLDAVGGVTVVNLAANVSTGFGSSGGGVDVRNAGGPVSVTGSSFDDHPDAAGLRVVATAASPSSDVTIDSTSTDANEGSGMSISASGTVTVRNNSTASNTRSTGSSDGDGLRVGGAARVLIDGSTFNGNARDGANFATDMAGVGGIAVDVALSFFDSNGEDGIQIGSAGAGQIVSGTVSIATSSFTGNGGIGIDADESGAVSLDGVSPDGNLIGVRVRDVAGLFIDDSAGVITMSANGDAVSAFNAGAVVIEGLVVDGVIPAAGPTPASNGGGVTVAGGTSVDIDDLTVADVAGEGLVIKNITGVVTLDAVVASDLPAGLDIRDVGGATTIRNSTFDNSDGSGIFAISLGPVVLVNTSTDNNGFAGVSLSGADSLSVTNHSASNNTTNVGFNAGNVTGIVTVTGGDFNGNSSGLDVTGAGAAVTVAGVSVSGNANTGLNVNAAGAVTVNGSTVVSANGSSGISVSSGGLVTVSANAFGNDRSGIDIDAATAVTITGSTVDGNGGSAGFNDGIVISNVAGAIQVTTSTVSNSVGHGLEVVDSTGSVTLDGSDFIDNGDAGATLGRSSLGSPSPVTSVSASGASFDRNVADGIVITASGNVALQNTTASANGGNGITILQAGDVTLSEVEAEDNPGNGLQAARSGITGTVVDDVAIVGGSFSNNDQSGAQVTGGGDVDIADAAFSGNDDRGARLNDIGAVTVDGATFDQNVGGGLSVSDTTGTGLITNSAFTDDGVLDADRSLTITSVGAPMTISELTFASNDRAISVDSATAKITIEDIEAQGGTLLVDGSDLVDVDIARITSTSVGAGVALRDIAGDVSVESSSFSGASQAAIELTDVSGDVEIIDTTVTDSRLSIALSTVGGAALIERSAIHGSGGADSAFELPNGIIEADAIIGGLELLNTSVFANEGNFPIDATSTEIALRHSTLADNDFALQVRTDRDIAIDHSVVLGRVDSSQLSQPQSLQLITPTGGSAPTLTAEFSMLSPGTTAGGTNLSQIDPLLSPPALNGGTTLSLEPFSTSLLVGAGNPNISGAPTTDQTGGQRIRDVIDIGAVEFEPDAVEPPPPPAPAAVFEPLSPARFVDTRSNGETFDGQFEADGTRQPGDEYRVQIAGRGGVPADAKGVVMNITAVRAQSRGFVTVHPCVDPRPVASSLNHTAGVNLGNEIIAGLNSSGELCIFTNQTTEITVDVTGFVASNSAAVSITPERMMDTRPGASTFDNIGDDGQKLEAGSNTILLLRSRGDIADDARSVILNITAVGAQRNGFVTVHPCSDEVPNASSLNYVAGVNRGNELVAALDPGGRICIFTSQEVHITVDATGYLPSDLSYRSIEPTRLLDTRPGQLTADGESEGVGIVEAGGSVTLPIAGREGIPANARAVVVNVTAIRAAANGFVTVHPCLDEPPLASSLNYVPGVNGANEIVVLLDDDGQMCLFTRSEVHLAVDVIGYLTAR